MKAKYLYLATVAAASLAISALPSSAAETKASSTDATFIKHAADVNMAEVQLGKIAQDNSQDQTVKDFGARMVKDHTNAEDQLKPIAEKMNVELPDHVSPAHQALIDKVTKLKGAEFDKEYDPAMVKGHKKAIAMFEKAKSDVKDSDLQKFAENTLPVLHEHLDLAKKLPDSK